MYIDDEDFRMLTDCVLKSHVYLTRIISKSINEEESKIVGIYDDESKPNQPNLDNLITKNANLEASSKEDELIIVYDDGSFRKKGRGLEYRFMSDDGQKSVCGKDENACYYKRYLYETGSLKQKNKKKKVLIGDYFRTYYETFKIRKDGSKINPKNEQMIKTIIEPNFGKMDIQTFTATHAKKLLKEYDDRKNRQKKIYIFMNEVFAMAKEEELISRNPMRVIKLESYEPNSFAAIQPADQKIILKNLKESKYITFFWYMCCTGFRLDNGLASIKNIDLEKCVVKGEKQDTATKKHKVSVPFLPELLDAEKIKLLKQVEYDDAERFFQGFFKNLGMNYVIHSFRKTFASCAYHVGFSEKWIQQKLGHKTKRVTDSYIELLENVDTPIMDYFRRLKEKLGL